LFGCGHSVEINDSAKLLDQLYQRHEQWQGTPYQLGGMSLQGIDCSGFVTLTYSQVFGIQLPRTTQAQAQLSGAVKKDELQTGDLVFFKVPDQGKLHHVGIYLEDHQFLHASTSQGVIISDLHDTYWLDNYWKALRVLD
jgi:cell wall-associated NlpC family hydrolase